MGGREGETKKRGGHGEKRNCSRSPNVSRVNAHGNLAGPLVPNSASVWSKKERKT